MAEKFNSLRGAFDKIIRKVAKFDNLPELLDLLYKGNLNDSKDFVSYDEETNTSWFATYFPAEVKEDKRTTHYVIMATFKDKLDDNTPNEVFESNRLSEIVLIPRRAYLTTKYPSNEANMIEIDDAYDMKASFAELMS